MCYKLALDHNRLARLGTAIFNLTEGHIGAVTYTIDHLRLQKVEHSIGNDEEWQDLMLRSLGSDEFLTAMVSMRGFPR